MSYFASFEKQLMAERRAVRTVTRDGKPVRELKCPECGTWGEIDDDQFHGHVSVLHEECGYHETVNWAAITEGSGE